MHAQPIEPARLLAHAGGLRALALQLLGDAHAADDVLQETFVRALKSPPPSHERLGGWLARVVRGLALNAQRNEAHRSEREQRYAREQASERDPREPGSYDGEERGEVLRALVEEVLALDEPYKSALLMRYFEGLTPSAIASRTHTPLATVASRLARGQAELRARLERRLKGSRGGFEGALALLAGRELVPAGTLAGGAATTKAGVSGAGGASPWLGAKTLALGGTALALGVLTVLLLRAGGDVEREGDTVARAAARETSADTSAELAPAPGDIAAVDGVREPSATRESAAATAGALVLPHDFGAGPYEFELEVVAIDAREHPLSAARVRAAPEQHTLNELGSTEWNGRFHKRWRGFAPTQTLVVQVSRDGYGESALTRVVLHADVVERMRLPMIDREKALLDSSTVLIRGVPPLSSSPPAFELDAHGNGVFVEPKLAPAPSLGPPVLANLPIIGNTFRVRYGGHGEVLSVEHGFGVSIGVGSGFHGPRLQTPAAVEGVVRDARGRLAPDVPVSLVAQEHAFGTGVTTDDEGHFSMHGPIGPARIVAGAPGCGHVELDLELEAGARELDLVLQAQHVLRMRLADEEDTPLASWRVEAWQHGDARVCVATGITQADGRAALAVPTNGAFDVLAFPLASKSAPPVTIATNLWVQDGELALVVSGGNALARAFDYFLADAEDGVLTTARVRLWTKDGRSGVELARAPLAEGDTARISKTWRMQDVVPGVYVVEVLASPLGGRRDITLSLARRMPGQTDEAPSSFGWAYGLELARRPAVDVKLTAGAREMADVTVWQKEGAALVRSETFSSGLPGRITLPPGALVLQLDRHAPGTPDGLGELEDETVGVETGGALTSETFGSVEGGVAAEDVEHALAPVAARGEAVDFEHESTRTRHELVGTGVQVLELAPVKSKGP